MGSHPLPPHTLFHQPGHKFGLVYAGIGWLIFREKYVLHPSNQSINLDENCHSTMVINNPFSPTPSRLHHTTTHITRVNEGTTCRRTSSSPSTIWAGTRCVIHFTARFGFCLFEGLSPDSCSSRFVSISDSGFRFMPHGTTDGRKLLIAHNLFPNARQSSFTLNFSRGASQIVGQYYNFLRLYVSQHVCIYL